MPCVTEVSKCSWATVTKWGDWKFGVVGNFAYNKNKIETWEVLTVCLTATSCVRSGSPINSWFVYRTDGFFQSDEEAQAWMDKYAGQDDIRSA